MKIVALVFLSALTGLSTFAADNVNLTCKGVVITQDRPAYGTERSATQITVNFVQKSEDSYVVTVDGKTLYDGKVTKQGNAISFKVRGEENYNVSVKEVNAQEDSDKSTYVELKVEALTRSLKVYADINGVLACK